MKFTTKIVVLALLFGSCTQETPAPGIPTEAVRQLPPLSLETPTIDQIYGGGYSKECAQLSLPPPQDLMDGLLVYSASNEIFLLDSGGTSHLMQEHVFSPSLSPNGRFLVFERFLSNAFPTLEVYDIEAGKTSSFKWGDLWHSLIGWANNEDILINLTKRGHLVNPMVSFNPFLHTKTEFSFDSLPVWNLHILYDWGPFGLSYAVLSPDLEKLIFPSFARDHESEGAVILWDLPSNSELAYVSMDRVLFGNMPSWKADSSAFVVNRSLANKAPLTPGDPTDQELFLVSLNGEIVQLTSFTQFFSDVIIGNYSWSPNGEFVAVWIKTNETGLGTYDKEQLVITNVDSGQIVDTCLQSSAYQTAAPVWFGSEYLAFTDEVEQGYLLNLSTMEAYKLPVEGRILGWSQ